MESPCYICDFKDEDKNLERCTNCEKRIKYAQGEFMIPTKGTEADMLERDRTATQDSGKPAKQKTGPKAKKVKAQIEPKKPKVSQQLYDLKQAAQYLGRPVWGVRELIWTGLLPSVKHGRKLYVDVKDMDKYIKQNKGIDDGGRPSRRNIKIEAKTRLQIGLHIMGTYDEETGKIIEDLRTIAKKELRSVQSQAFYFLRECVEKWKEGHK